jgi:hypothetical protein
LWVAGLLSEPNTLSGVRSILSGVRHAQLPDTSNDSPKAGNTIGGVSFQKVKLGHPKGTTKIKNMNRTGHAAMSASGQ